MKSTVPISEAREIALHLIRKNKLSIKPLSSNRPDRHWNFKITTATKNFLLRIENPLAAAQRGTNLQEEIKILKLFGKYALAPRLIAERRIQNHLALLEEWINAPHLHKKLSRKELRNIIFFLAAVNRISLTKRTKALVPWKTDFLDIASRRAMVYERLKKGKKIQDFRVIIRELAPLLELGLRLLESEIASIPKSVRFRTMFSYRDIHGENILATKPHYRAVDWEQNAVGLSDPSFSLVTLMRRFKLSENECNFVINEYNKLFPVPYLKKLVHARKLERTLGEATWPFAWVARRASLHLPNQRKEIQGAIANARIKIRELTVLLRIAEG